MNGRAPRTALTAAHRLVAYGTLRPGQSNHDQLAGLNGVWVPGTVRGRVTEAVWQGNEGYPGIILDPDGGAVAVEVFESADLPNHWPRLDAFEGPGYRRTLVAVSTSEGEIEGSIYELLARD
ncbi:MAG: gamma-glutamylcyclotransferase [Rhodospirillaceae bacterium]